MVVVAVKLVVRRLFYPGMGLIPEVPVDESQAYINCPYLLFSETTAKGTGLEKLAGKEDPVELDSSLAL